MLKSIFSLLDNKDGNIQVTVNHKGDNYTVAIVPFEKPELSISLTGSIEEITNDMLSITAKYKTVIRTATEQVEALEIKVKEATKKKTKTKKESVKPVKVEDNKKIEEEIQEAEQKEFVENLETTVEENNKVLDDISSKEEKKEEEKKEVSNVPNDSNYNNFANVNDLF